MKVYRPTEAQLQNAYIVAGNEAIEAFDKLGIEFPVDKTITILVSWVNIPGDNTQRSQHWAKNMVWKSQLETDFGKSLKYTMLPEKPLKKPKVLMYGVVGSKTDLFNIGSRYKKVLDLLQIAKKSKTGKKTGGFNIIVDDKNVLPVVIEKAERVKTVTGHSRRLVVVIVWDDAEIIPVLVNEPTKVKDDNTRVDNITASKKPTKTGRHIKRS